MAKGKRSSKRPQPQHNKNRKPSQFDKRARLDRRNSNRRRTKQARVPLVGWLLSVVSSMQSSLDARMAFRLSIIMAGILLSGDRRTASAWFVAAGVQDDWDRFYDGLRSIGQQTTSLAFPLLLTIVRKFDPGPDGRFVLAVDDTPTQRYGKHVEGAGVHHHPTPGPADGKWLYGHNWVTLAFLAKHSLWGVIALPLRSLLYVRAVDVPQLEANNEWKFRTKHELAVELVLWFLDRIEACEMMTKVWVVADGAYAARPFLVPLLARGITAVGRLRKDAVLFDLPCEKQERSPGRPPIYGTGRIDLKKRFAHLDGWQTITYSSRGEQVTRAYKTFLATSQLVSGVIRVVIVRYDDDRWAPHFCTDATADVQTILETVADRWAIEEHFHDVKEVWGAGQQQVRNIWSNIGCWHLNQWMYTLVELACWDCDKSQLTDRQDRPWDNVDRRPSHADRRRTITRQMLENQFLTALPDTPEAQQFRTLLAGVLSLCV